MQLANVRKCQSFLSTRTSTTFKGATNMAKTMENTINPIFEETTWQNFTSVISRSLKVTPKMSCWEKRIRNKKKLHIQNSNEKCYIASRFVCLLLFMIRKTFSPHEWERLTAWFTTREESTGLFCMLNFQICQTMTVDKGGN